MVFVTVTYLFFYPPYNMYVYIIVFYIKLIFLKSQSHISTKTLGITGVANVTQCVTL